MKHYIKKWYWLLPVMVVFALGSCKSLSLQAENVRMTRHQNDITDCRALGEVTSKPPWVGPKDAENTLRNKTAELGGDVLLVTRMSVGTAKGQAYDCYGKFKNN